MPKMSMQNTPEIYGLSFHSPLTIKLLVPPTYYAVYLSHDWQGSSLKKNLEPCLEKAVQKAKHEKKTILVLAGNLTVLQQFIKDYPDLPAYKVILFDFPGVIVPFEDPLIEWLDCDHQAGGAWQTSKIKIERLEEDLTSLNFLGAKGKDLLCRMKRFCPRDSRVSEIEHFAEMFAEGLPKDYKDLLNSSITNDRSVTDEEPEIEIDWKSQTFEQVLTDVLRCFDDNLLRQKVLSLSLSYQTGKISKREFTATSNKFLAGKENLKKLLIVIKKWIDDKKLGRALYTRYLDYLAHLEKRSWERIVNEGKINVSERDLLLLIGYQQRSPEVLDSYSQELKSVTHLPPDQSAPKKLYKTTKNELSYHPEPIDPQNLFI